MSPQHLYPQPHVRVNHSFVKQWVPDRKLFMSTNHIEKITAFLLIAVSKKKTNE